MYFKRSEKIGAGVWIEKGLQKNERDRESERKNEK